VPGAAHGIQGICSVRTITAPSANRLLACESPMLSVYLSCELFM